MSSLSEQTQVKVGVDLGTAYIVLAVLDEQRQPLAGEYCFAEVVRDGLVVDFHGAIQRLAELKQNVEARLGFELTSAAVTYPPGVPLAEVRATRHVVEAVGLDCRQAIDEPTAANAVLQVENGAVVDVGGGTTGIAVIRTGEVIYTADEPTGGTHFSLSQNHNELFPLVRPVMEKIASIIARHINGYDVETLYLVGGTACFTGIDQVLAEETGLKTVVPSHPLFVTPFGVAMHDV
jgi:ethanolamine utilization protein EutJ